MSDGTQQPQESKKSKWQPISREQRRIVGVLVEKAKTTPDAYPLTLNSLTTGCNQKSNRNPQMDIASDDVELELDELREMHAVTEIQGSGRTAKYRHNLYDWLGVDKTELAVMAELLLRGEQTLGELRGRAARMEPIADVGALRPIVRSLMDKNLIQALTPEGRGQIVTHTLYLPHEIDKVKARAGELAAESSSAEARSASGSASRSSASRSSAADSSSELAELKSQVQSLAEQVKRLTERLDVIES